MLTIIELRGKTGEWLVTSDMSRAQIDAMREDGIEVGIVENMAPEWIVDIGLLKPWCFVQDVWNLRNPFTK